MASISYGILVCNEVVELNRLLGNLTAYLRPQDEIVILVDEPRAPASIKSVIDFWQDNCKETGKTVKYYFSKFTGNFAKWREELALYCKKDWIFQIDADELVELKALLQLPELLDSAEVEAYAFSRINTVTGLTQEDIDKWKWKVNEHGWVNWPDWQARLYKNNGKWHWIGEVHEHLYAEDKSVQCILLSLYHPKDIERQRRQNAFYGTYKQ